MFRITGDNEGAVLRDEGTKNPIIFRMRINASQRDRDRDREIIALARDFYHSFIAKTIGRRYNRPPIYLVDDLVALVLGAFVQRAPRNLHQWADDRRMAQAQPMHHLGLFDRGDFGNVIRLFQALHAFLEQLQGARLLHVAAMADQLQEACTALVGQPAALPQFGQLVGIIQATVDRASATLLGDIHLANRVNPEFAVQTRQLGTELVARARQFVDDPGTAPLGVSFDIDRGSGLLFEGIPELGIRAPAILLAPNAIARWSRSAAWAGLRHSMSPEELETTALANVLFHEMTHAMLALATDPVQDQIAMDVQRISHYRTDQLLEEGIADFTANVISVYGLLRFRHRHGPNRDLPDLNDRRFTQDVQDLLAALWPTYENYSNPSTDRFFAAWRRNKYDFNAFAGMIHMYACNFGDMDWEQTQRDLTIGKVSIGDRGGR